MVEERTCIFNFRTGGIWEGRSVTSAVSLPFTTSVACDRLAFVHSLAMRARKLNLPRRNFTFADV